jgi:hypothetical protein
LNIAVAGDNNTLIGAAAIDVAYTSSVVAFNDALRTGGGCCVHDAVKMRAKSELTSQALQ